MCACVWRWGRRNSQVKRAMTTLDYIRGAKGQGMQDLIGPAT